MGTSYRVKITATPRQKSMTVEAFKAETDMATQVFDRNGSVDVFNASTLVDTGKWNWAECMEEVCKATHGLVFTVHYVSEYGDANAEFYLSGVGYMYTESLKVPTFTETQFRKVFTMRAQVRRAEVLRIKKENELKEKALKKLSVEERKVLGLPA